MRKYTNTQIDAAKKEMSARLGKHQEAIKEIKEQSSKDAKLIKILHNKDDQTNHKKLENIVERTVRQVLFEQEKDITEKITDKKKTIIYLNKDFELWRDPKDKFCYSLQSKGKRIDLINVLSQTYKSSETLCSQTGYALGSGLYDAIKEINRNVKKYLDVQYPFIESRQGEGYKINPVYKLIKR